MQLGIVIHALDVLDDKLSCGLDELKRRIEILKAIETHPVQLRSTWYLRRNNQETETTWQQKPLRPEASATIFDA